MDRKIRSILKDRAVAIIRLKHENLSLKEVSARADRLCGEATEENRKLKAEVELWKGHHALLATVVMLATRKP